MIDFILQYLFIFITGATMGWLIEIVFRRFYGPSKKWINPGFLSGPYLPLYGTGVVFLYIVSSLTINIGVKILVFAAITTLIEYATGIFFLKGYNTRLWDYSNEKFNFKGIIAPKFSLYWTLLSLVFYYLLYPYFYQKVEFLYSHLELSLFVGMFYGVMLVDLIYAFNLLNRLKKMADVVSDSKIAINYERLKLEITERFEDLSEDLSERVESVSSKMDRKKVKNLKPSFLLPFRGDYNLRHEVKVHIDKLREARKVRENIDEK